MAVALGALSFTGAASLVPTPSSAQTVESAAPSWTVYHGDPTGTGVASSVTGVHTDSRAWTSPVLEGSLYGEPLVSAGRVFVATEADTVDALSAVTGAVIWSTKVGAPVPSGSLPCGDISPTVGITGTPVIDPARGELFVVADVLSGGAPAHELFGIGLGTGGVLLREPVDPSGSDPRALLQRTGLALDDGRVVFGFGGNYGDCSTYKGWVVSAPEAGGTPSDFAVDAGPGEHEGAIWMGGAAPVVDAAGNVWVSSGNGSVTSASGPYDDSDAVLELSPGLQLLQYFAPSTWRSDNASDHDLSTSPVLLADGQVVAAGKSRTVYLLDGSHLGGIGGELAELTSACGDDISGGAAEQGTTVYLPCLSGTVALDTVASPPSLHVAWSSSVGGGPPIVAGGLVWSIGQDGHLYGLDPASGSVRQRAAVGVPANHFPTPGIGAGLLLATSARQVVAFATTPTVSAPSTTSTTAPHHAAAKTAQQTSPSSSGLSPGILVLIVLGGLLVVGATAWAIRRRLRSGG